MYSTNMLHWDYFTCGIKRLHD